MMSDTKQKVVFYHDDCVDGMTSAWVAWRHLKDEAWYIPVQHSPDPHVPWNVLDKDVYIVDFCFPVDVMRTIAVQARSLVVLDHHKTAQEAMRQFAWEMKDIDHVYIKFDMERSGAGLTARYFGEPDNWWVNYVEDRDLWRFKLDKSETINAFIQSVERSIDKYESTYASLDVEEAIVLGMGAQRYLDMYVREVTKHSRSVTFCGYDNVPMINAPFVGISEVVGHLARHALFAVGWSQKGNGDVVFSLRSRGEFDVSELAKRFGGGGHRGAAGFTVRAPDIDALFPALGGA